MLTHWNNNPRIDMSLYSDTLFWFRANQSLLFLLNAACLAEKHQIPILKCLVWPDQDSNPRFTALEACTLTITLTITPTVQCKDDMLWERNNILSEQNIFLVGTKYLSCGTKIISWGNNIICYGNKIICCGSKISFLWEQDIILREQDKNNSSMALISHRKYMYC